jgi:hypothetical protein
LEGKIKREQEAAEALNGEVEVLEKAYETISNKNKALLAQITEKDQQVA